MDLELFRTYNGPVVVVANHAHHDYPIGTIGILTPGFSNSEKLYKKMALSSCYWVRYDDVEIASRNKAKAALRRMKK